MSIDDAKSALELAKNIGNSLADLLPIDIGIKLTERRYNRILRFIDEIDPLLKERGYTIDELRLLNDNLKIPIVEAVSLEDDEDIRKLWKNLLTNELDQNFKGPSACPAFINTIKNLSPIDAKILNSINKKDAIDGKLLDFILSHISSNKDLVSNSIYRLSSSRLIEEPKDSLAIGGYTWFDINDPDTYEILNEFTKITPYGKSFIEACCPK
jgi:hypothetical protein